MRRSLLGAAALVSVLCMPSIACRRELPGAERALLSTEALRFARHLMARDYAAAHALTSPEYQARVSVDSLGRAFEFSVPLDMRPTDSLFVQMTDRMTGWAVWRPGDVGWVYVVIPGDSMRDQEAVSMIFAREGGALVIREVEIGRP